MTRLEYDIYIVIKRFQNRTLAKYEDKYYYKKNQFEN